MNLQDRQFWLFHLNSPDSMRAILMEKAFKVSPSTVSGTEVTFFLCWMHMDSSSCLFLYNSLLFSEHHWILPEYSMSTILHFGFPSPSASFADHIPLGPARPRGSPGDVWLPPLDALISVAGLWHTGQWYPCHIPLGVAPGEGKRGVRSYNTHEKSFSKPFSLQVVLCFLPPTPCLGKSFLLFRGNLNVFSLNPQKGEDKYFEHI